MDLESVLDRFAGTNFVLYDGTEEILAQMRNKVNVLVWFTRGSDPEANPPRSDYTQFFNTIYDANYLIVGNGNMGRSRAEVETMRILRAPSMLDNRTPFARNLIFHGYPGFITTGIPVTKEVYANGAIVGLEDDRVETLREIADLLDKEIRIPVPLRDVSAIENVGEVLPYIHVRSRIRDLTNTSGEPRIPLTDEMPVDVMNTNNPLRQMEYEVGRYTSAINWGQRKLLMSEIELLDAVIRRDIQSGGDGMGFTIVYVGAAPGHHIPYLLGLFARYRVSAHLWDRRERFGIPESGNLRIIPSEFEDPAMTGDTEGFFTNEVAQRYISQYGQNNRLIFVSDIRDTASEEAVLRDMEMQQGWVRALNPYASQLKFRLPFLGNDTYTYLDGDIYTQAWARNKSSESRLLSFRPYQSREYNVRDYDRSFAYFNMITRVSSYNIGNVIDTTMAAYGASQPSGIGRFVPVPDIGYCTCHDCAREAQILAKYLALMRFPVNENTIVSLVRRNTEASRPYTEQQTNPRTLWTKVSVKVPPHDRKNLVLFREMPEEGFAVRLQQAWISTLRTHNLLERHVNEIIIGTGSLLSITPASVSTVLMYGDGMDVNSIIDAFLEKRPQLPRFLGAGADMQGLFREVLRGRRVPVMFNLHTDFVQNYNAGRDLGTLGARQLGLLSQNIAIARSNGMNMDEWGHVLLFVLSYLLR